MEQLEHSDDEEELDPHVLLGLIHRFSLSTDQLMTKTQRDILGLMYHSFQSTCVPTVKRRTD